MKSTFYHTIFRIILIGILAIPSFQLSGQTNEENSGSIRIRRILRGEIQELQVVNARGRLQWQTSKNGSEWHDLTGKTSSTLSMVANELAFIRCVITEAKCDPIFSDMVEIIPFGSAIVTTKDISLIKADSATSGGTVIDEGGLSVSAKGVCWSTVPEPTIADRRTGDGTGAGAFTSVLTGLSGGTYYYVRAYATNAWGTSYGEQVKFRTTLTPPIVTTAPVTSITRTTATSGGNVVSDGGLTLSARGVCWSTTPAPTISNSKTVDGAATGHFVSLIGGLAPNTVYYIRAYATNSLGTSYGEQVAFTTSLGM